MTSQSLCVFSLQGLWSLYFSEINLAEIIEFSVYLTLNNFISYQLSFCEPARNMITRNVISIKKYKYDFDIVTMLILINLYVSCIVFFF